MQKQCDQCNKLYEPKIKKQRFCSNHCKVTWGNRHKAFPGICVACGSPFVGKNKTQRFCSASCSTSATVPIRTLVCVDCAKSFEFKGRTRKLRCETCWKKWASDRQMRWRASKHPEIKLGAGSGGVQWRESNHAWNPDGKYHDRLRGLGYTPGYTRVCWQNWNKECAVNPAHPGTIEVHHADGVRDNCHPENLVPLCRVCHKQIHRNRKFKSAAEYIEATMSILPEVGRNKIAELSGKAEMPTRTEGCTGVQSGAERRE